MEEDDSDDSLHTIQDEEDTYNVFNYQDPLLHPPMIRAVINNDLNAIKALVEAEQSVNYNNNEGRTCLHVAVVLQNREIFDYLVNLEDTRLDATDFRNFTPLCLSIVGHDEYFALELIKRQANVNHGPVDIEDHFSCYPLHLAVAYNKENIATNLIEHGADINKTNEDGSLTPLAIACYHNFTDCIHLLMYFGADPCIRDSEFNSPLCYLLMRQDIDIIDTFMEYMGFFDLEDLNVALFCKTELATRMVEQSSDLDYSEDSISSFFQAFGFMTVDFLNMFIQKFPSILEQVLKVPTLWDVLRQNDGCETDKVIYVLLQHPHLHSMIRNLKVREQYLIIPTICSRIQPEYYEKPQMLSLFEKMIYIVLGEGIEVTSADMYIVHRHFGYSQLLKTMLFMKIKEIPPQLYSDKNSVLCKLLYDPSINLKYLVDNPESFDFFEFSIDSVKKLLAFSALPKLKRYCMEVGIIKTTDSSNNVPKLQELARDVSRDYVTKVFGITRSSQYYSALKRLDIPEICIKILSFELPLY